MNRGNGFMLFQITDTLNTFRKQLNSDGLSDQTISLFREIVWNYYTANKRDFPWRHTVDPYRIFVSEIMLQQTQVDRVVPKYAEFLKAFPDFSSLGNASLKDVLRIWQGMGYNRRAKALKEGAMRVMKEFNGDLPDDERILMTFPGIGKATASSIVTFAFNKPAVFIETNIRRIFIYFFFPDQEGIDDRSILELVEKTLDRENPREWYYGLMDYGAMLKKYIQNPNRRSSSYTRQSRFEGSDRQIRGILLKTILMNGKISEHDLIVIVKKEPERMRKVLRQMVAEGFIKQQGLLFYIN
jgi:A/G-specific adenine glycosylase